MYSKEPVETLLDHEHDYKLVVVASRNRPLNESDKIALIGGPFVSEKDAWDRAAVTRRALLLWSIASRVGIDLGNNQASGGMSDYLIKKLEASTDFPLIRRDVHGIDIFKVSSRGNLFSSGSAFMPAYKHISQLTEVLESSLRVGLRLSEKLQLACEIFSATSFFDSSDRSRFISMITAIEAMLDLNASSSKIRDLIDDFILTTQSSLDEPNEVKALVSRLSLLKRESIRQAGQKFAQTTLPDQTYKGLLPGVFFKKCYDIRSKIVHNGKTSLSAAEFTSWTDWYSIFMRDLLLKSVRIENPDLAICD